MATHQQEQPGHGVEAQQTTTALALQQLLGASLVRAVDVHFRFDDRHEAGGDNLSGDVELLEQVLDRAVVLLEQLHRQRVALTTTGPGAANTLGAVGEAWASRSP